jgi:MFS family permease
MGTTTKSSRLIKATPFFYGWIIVVAGTISSVMVGPSQTFTIGIFIDSFIADLNLSRSAISLIYGLATLGAAWLLPMMGRLIDRYGSRRLVLAVAFLFGLACFAVAGVRGIFGLFITMLALRYLGFGSLRLVSNSMVARWFIRQRGLVMGLSGLSLPLGLLIFPDLAAWLLSHFSWRQAWLIMGLIVWAVVLPLGWFFFKDTPEQYGLLPDGDQKQDRDRQPAWPVNERDWTLAEARRTGVFWLFVIALSIITMILAGLVFHQLSLFEARNLSRETAISAFRSMALFAIVGNLAVGHLLDKLSARFLLSVTLFLLAAALILIQWMTTPGQAFMVGLLVGLVSGSFRVMDGTVWAKYFGRRHLGAINGTSQIGVLGATALGPYALGLSLDLFGSYNPMLIGLVIVSLLTSGLAFLTRRPEKAG